MEQQRVLAPREIGESGLLIGPEYGGQLPLVAFLITRWGRCGCLSFFAFDGAVRRASCISLCIPWYAWYLVVASPHVTMANDPTVASLLHRDPHRLSQPCCTEYLMANMAAEC